MTIADLSVRDFPHSDAEESDSEGLVDHLRAVEGTHLAALVRDRSAAPGSRKGRCARATRASTSPHRPGPGRRGPSPGRRLQHRALHEELVSFLREQLAAQS